MWPSGPYNCNIVSDFRRRPRRRLHQCHRRRSQFCCWPTNWCPASASSVDRIASPNWCHCFVAWTWVAGTVRTCIGRLLCLPSCLRYFIASCSLLVIYSLFIRFYSFYFSCEVRVRLSVYSSGETNLSFVSMLLLLFFHFLLLRISTDSFMCERSAFGFLLRVRVWMSEWMRVCQSNRRRTLFFFGNHFLFLWRRCRAREIDWVCVAGASMRTSFMWLSCYPYFFKSKSFLNGFWRSTLLSHLTLQLQLLAMFNFSFCHYYLYFLFLSLYLDCLLAALLLLLCPFGFFSVLSIFLFVQLVFCCFVFCVHTTTTRTTQKRKEKHNMIKQTFRLSVVFVFALILVRSQKKWLSEQILL